MDSQTPTLGRRYEVHLASPVYQAVLDGRLSQYNDDPHETIKERDIAVIHEINERFAFTGRSVARRVTEVHAIEPGSGRHVGGMLPAQGVLCVHLDSEPLPVLPEEAKPAGETDSRYSDRLDRQRQVEDEEFKMRRERVWMHALDLVVTETALPDHLITAHGRQHYADQAADLADRLTNEWAKRFK